MGGRTSRGDGEGTKKSKMHGIQNMKKVTMRAGRGPVNMQQGVQERRGWLRINNLWCEIYYITITANIIIINGIIKLKLLIGVKIP